MYIFLLMTRYMCRLNIPFLKILEQKQDSMVQTDIQTNQWKGLGDVLISLEIRKLMNSGKIQ